MKSRRPPLLATWLGRWLSEPYRREALLGDAHCKGSWALIFLWWVLLAAASYEWKWPVILLAADPGLYWLIHRDRRRFRFRESLL